MMTANLARHEQPCIFHWKYAQRLRDFDFGRIMPASEIALRKGCGAISPPVAWAGFYKTNGYNNREYCAVGLIGALYIVRSSGRKGV
jgi:hypothetical protein